MAHANHVVGLALALTFLTPTMLAPVALPWGGQIL